MATEPFIVIALPHSVAEGADFHVFAVHRPRARAGCRRVRSSTSSRSSRTGRDRRRRRAIELFDQDGTIECTAAARPHRAEVWDAVFPPDTPFRRPGAGLPRAAVAHVPRRLPARRGQGPPRRGDVHRPDVAAAAEPPPARAAVGELPPRSTRCCASAYDESLITELHDRADRRVQAAPTSRCPDSSITRRSRARRFAMRAAPRPAVLRAAGVRSRRTRPGRPTGRPCRKLDPPKPDFHERVHSSATTRRCCAGSGWSSTSGRRPRAAADSDWLSARIVPRRRRRGVPRDPGALRGGGRRPGDRRRRRTTGTTGGCGSATPISSRCSTWTPTAPP